MKSITPEQVQQLRAGLGLTREEMGKKFKVTASSILNWENGNCSPKPDREGKLIQAYKQTFNGPGKHANGSNGNASGQRQRRSVAEKRILSDEERLQQRANHSLIAMVADLKEINRRKFREAVVLLLRQYGKASCEDIAQQIVGHVEQE